MDDDDPDDPDSIPGGRKRQFPPLHKGPYTVSIREHLLKLTPIKFALYINKKYKNILEIKQLPHRMKVILSDREEANILVYTTKHLKNIKCTYLHLRSKLTV